MSDISGFGTVLNLVASVTYPQGITLTQASDDTDFLDSPSQQIGDAVLGTNGDMITWSKASITPTTVSFIPNSEDDLNMAVLLENNKVGQGKTSVNDIITVTAVLPDGSTATYINGKLTDGMTGNSIASTGRLKTKVYGFKFEKVKTTKATSN